MARTSTTVSKNNISCSIHRAFAEDKESQDRRGFAPRIGDRSEDGGRACAKLHPSRPATGKACLRASDPLAQRKIAGRKIQPSSTISDPIRRSTVTKAVGVVVVLVVACHPECFGSNEGVLPSRSFKTSFTFGGCSNHASQTFPCNLQGPFRWGLSFSLASSSTFEVAIIV